MTIYTALATEDSYGQLLALVEDGDAVLRGERYTLEGIREIAVETIDVQTNPRITAEGLSGDVIVADRYFVDVEGEYKYGTWKMAWWREAIQNSVDAKATQIDCRIEYDDTLSVVNAPAWKITCEDNGRGMDEDIFLDAFVVLGGTGKEEDVDATGGFGVAKALLCFPWMFWEVRTQNLYASGEGMHWNVKPVPGWKAGMRLSVWMPDDKHLVGYQCEEVISRSWLPRVSFSLLDESGIVTHPAADEKAGKLQERFPNANLYMKRSDYDTDNLYVRDKNGVYMFEKSIKRVPRRFILKLTGKSTKLLTRNRMDFADEALDGAFENFKETLAADVLSKLRKQQGFVEEKYYGASYDLEGEWKNSVAEIEDELGEMQPSGFTMEEFLAALKAMNDRKGKAQEERAREAPAETKKEAEEKVPAATEAIADYILKVTDLRGANDSEALIKQLAWEPHFLLLNNKPHLKLGKRFRPSGMLMPLRVLLRYWAEMCRAVCAMLHTDKVFGVGFIFEDGIWSPQGTSYVQAAYKYYDTDAETGRKLNEHWLLICPFRKGNTDDREIMELCSRGLRCENELFYVYQRAVHEVSHMIAGHVHRGDHDEAFQSFVESNTRKTWQISKTLRKLLAAVNKSVKEKQSQLTAMKPPPQPKGKKAQEDLKAVARWVLSNNNIMEYWGNNGRYNEDALQEIAGDVADRILPGNFRHGDRISSWHSDLIWELKDEMKARGYQQDGDGWYLPGEAEEEVAEVDEDAPMVTPFAMEYAETILLRERWKQHDAVLIDDAKAAIYCAVSEYPPEGQVTALDVQQNTEAYKTFENQVIYALAEDGLALDYTAHGDAYAADRYKRRFVSITSEYNINVDNYWSDLVTNLPYADVYFVDRKQEEQRKRGVDTPLGFDSFNIVFDDIEWMNSEIDPTDPHKDLNNRIYRLLNSVAPHDGHPLAELFPDPIAITFRFRAEPDAGYGFDFDAIYYVEPNKLTLTVESYGGDNVQRTFSGGGCDNDYHLIMGRVGEWLQMVYEQGRDAYLPLNPRWGRW